MPPSSPATTAPRSSAPSASSNPSARRAAPRRAGRVEQVAPGVRIGMVRGGPVEPVAGFGFPRQGLDHSAIAAVTATLKAASGPSPEVASIGEAASPRPVRSKPRKKPARKVAKARTAKAPVSDATAHG
ncbi:hypothetical protein EJ070_29490 [Mesorhizobium sp. M1E.F.Ca.ET.045.02.1.1]|uniref:hypothetical protein n=1 Tax=Mesorhizobium sp. M1E.F.Ca.ET.045.02.1.1 TaxID=2493672 RepID=UPI000F74C892|nr:hypothetical protein [Mesorhizobium sp. M1E.F.Ca.ET.045.02.1.1]AZO24415.1 hypothetical protein EJ070_29490 [Mesorhizobium sp. M1E.F.Ca.ET.045.02.1.1]